MVKKEHAVAALALGVAATAGAVALARAKPPVEEGAPEGEVSIEVTPIGKPGGYGFEEIKGQWGVGAVVRVNGVCTAGFPTPSMVLELYDDGVLRATTTIPEATLVLGTAYPLEETMGAADIGDHVVYGRMVLENPLGAYEFTTATQSFSIGEAPPGEVTLEVTLTPA